MRHSIHKPPMGFGAGARAAATRLACLICLICAAITAVATESESEPADPAAPGARRNSQPPCVHPRIGTSASAPDGSISLRLVDKRQHYGGGRETDCPQINSPKSVHISPDGRKFYVNSLEGGNTVVFDTETRDVIKVISHRITAAHDSLWATPRPDLYPFTHYTKNNHFTGKPVESTFSHGGRYLWVPYYRRSYDINAQDPSACAVIDTQTDSIIRLFETGPLPKMIATSPDGRYIAISHWGNNTVGLIDITSNDPALWHHTDLLTVDYVLPLDYPLDRSVDRDTGSGYALRGTVFTPDGRYLLVGCMGGGGGIAVIDLEQRRYLGRVLGMMANVRHLLIDGEWLYLSVNKSGYVQRCRLADFIAAAQGMGQRRTATFTGWQNAKVGAGARTIEISPSGRYIFAACNFASELCVVDTRTMRQVCSIQVDSYPVGLDISDDGRYIYTTSQGRAGAGGGNAVDIYEVTYAEAEPADRSFTAPPFTPGPPLADAAAPEPATPPADNPGDPAETTYTAVYIGGGILLAGAATLAVRRMRRR